MSILEMLNNQLPGITTGWVDLNNNTKKEENELVLDFNKNGSYDLPEVMDFIKQRVTDLSVIKAIENILNTAESPVEIQTKEIYLPQIKACKEKIGLSFQERMVTLCRQRAGFLQAMDQQGYDRIELELQKLLKEQPQELNMKLASGEIVPVSRVVLLNAEGQIIAWVQQGEYVKELSLLEYSTVNNKYQQVKVLTLQSDIMLFGINIPKGSVLELSGGSNFNIILPEKRGCVINSVPFEAGTILELDVDGIPRQGVVANNIEINKIPILEKSLVKFDYKGNLKEAILARDIKINNIFWKGFTTLFFEYDNSINSGILLNDTLLEIGNKNRR
ncbi:MAG: hypothetical protein KKA19_04785 [Candidatus Margulisbacteria bacterium]|nr:hypothetical protein [Candidatus Margulisiibacteriota bacterium]